VKVVSRNSNGSRKQVLSRRAVSGGEDPIAWLVWIWKTFHEEPACIRCNSLYVCVGLEIVDLVKCLWRSTFVQQVIGADDSWKCRKRCIVIGRLTSLCFEANQY